MAGQAPQARTGSYDPCPDGIASVEELMKRLNQTAVLMIAIGEGRILIE